MRRACIQTEFILVGDTKPDFPRTKRRIGSLTSPSWVLRGLLLNLQHELQRSSNRFRPFGGTHKQTWHNNLTIRTNVAHNYAYYLRAFLYAPWHQPCQKIRRLPAVI